MELRDVFRLPNIILRYTPNRQIPIIMMQIIEPNAFFSQAKLPLRRVREGFGRNPSLTRRVVNNPR